MNDAWKLRAMVYVPLAVFAALVLVPRFTTSGEGQVAHGERVETLTGYTSQGAHVRVDVIGRRVVAVFAYKVWPRCRHRPGRPLSLRFRSSGPYLLYSRRGSVTNIHELWRPGWSGHAYMHGTLSQDLRRLEGVFGYSVPLAFCASGPVRFSASR